MGGHDVHSIRVQPCSAAPRKLCVVKRGVKFCHHPYETAKSKNRRRFDVSQIRESVSKVSSDVAKVSCDVVSMSCVGRVDVARRRENVGTYGECGIDSSRHKPRHLLKIRQTDRERISDLRSKVAILAVQNRKNTRKTDFGAFAIRTYVNYERRKPAINRCDSGRRWRTRSRCFAPAASVREWRCLRLGRSLRMPRTSSARSARHP